MNDEAKRKTYDYEYDERAKNRFKIEDDEYEDFYDYTDIGFGATQRKRNISNQ